MAWYDFFANFYDASVERYYATHRPLAAEALAIEPGHVVLDCPCGTGQSFDVLADAVGPHGRVVGVDQSEGMLRRARARIDANGWKNVACIAHDAATLSHDALASCLPDSVRIDRLHIFLGMSVFPAMEETFERLWALLAQGGRCAIVDVHAERLGVQGWMVETISGGQIRRRSWEPLERRAVAFQRRDLPYVRQHGGQIMLAVGNKPFRT